MKKLFYGLMICALAFIATSCGFKSEEKPLHGSLVTFTAPDDGSDGILLGVREKTPNPDDSRVIVTPARYASITADDNVIICRVSDLKVEAYKHDGDPIGNGEFETFTRMPREEVVYMGTNYKTSTWYFPAQDETCAVKSSYQGLKLLFLRLDTGVWEVRSYDGKTLWTTPGMAEGRKYWLIKDTKAPGEEFYFAVTGGKTPACTLYDCNGKELKKLNASHWRLTQKKLKAQKELDAETVYAEIDGIRKF